MRVAPRKEYRREISREFQTGNHVKLVAREVFQLP
jgi:hypothetical protein